ncbi:hypothetical protein BMS3Bbin11_01887 [bacterium BMS3Bbin11]|nr:hypothetical protein BMS3Abin11_00893 [bacterium BMS3Abin11]GBE46786.1 hypothetical protein BMS3Bbin11_01887 [bacterium BMS3Bbin11]GMT40367.1 MAG: hypothetical protein IEMM0001_1102 [bacterium]HDH08983.1 DUF1499 domain-containing protein [Gammaproteobacteria bacterium]HDH16038.1 DUF1499 domain-containing protein [Gammaproteobacteria bacterium]
MSNVSPEPVTRTHMNKIVVTGFVLIVLSVVAAMIAPLGSRIGYWDYTAAVMILEWAAYTGTASALICLIGTFVVRPRNSRLGFFLTLLGLAIIIPTLLYLMYWKDAEENAPPIQDITTNTENPPEFWAAPNARVYGGAAVATYQKEAYPYIQPLLLPVPPDKAFDYAIEVVRQKGWDLLDANRKDMHIEATESTFWFGFSDDVAINITATDSGGSRVDMRSTSRFGSGGDGGTNARRIRSFFATLKPKADK